MNKPLWLGLGFFAVSMLAQGEEQNPLLGCWQCTSDGEPVPLRFEAKTYVIDGEPLPYEVVQGAIQVSEPDGYSRYPYILKNGQLTINFDDIPPLICARVSCPGKKSAVK
jgi:hypothetical protein